jgi:hypothetical protein
LTKPEFEFFDPLLSLDMPWLPVDGVPGASEMILARDPATGDHTRLLRLDPGTDTSQQGALRHSFWEEVWIIAGSLHDLTLDRTFRSGMYACRPPGMPHGPWRSPDGALTFEIRYKE